jgi:hypothetical protein
MKKLMLFVGCVSGVLIGILICLVYQRATWAAQNEKADNFGDAGEWNSFSLRERMVYAQGYVEGYSLGSDAVCENADQLFTTTGPTFLKDGTLNHPVIICKAALDHFTRAGRQDKVLAKFSVYSDVITEFYRKYPKYDQLHFSFLLTLLSDKNLKTADELFQKLERHDMQITF